jgi:hypothetical protein
MKEINSMELVEFLQMLEEVMPVPRIHDFKGNHSITLGADKNSMVLTLWFTLNDEILCRSLFLDTNELINKELIEKVKNFCLTQPKDATGQIEDLVAKEEEKPNE